MKAEALMTASLKSCVPDENPASVVRTMWTENCGVVPVVNGRGETVGIVTDRDICMVLGARDVPASSLTARDLMSQPVIACASDDDCFILLATMEQHRVRRLPVVGADDVLLGIVSLDDIVKRAGSAPAGDPLRWGVVDVLATIGGHERGGSPVSRGPSLQTTGLVAPAPR